MEAISTPIGVVRSRYQFDKLRAMLADYNRTLPATMTEVDAAQAAPHIVGNRPIQAWRSSQFIAALYVEPGKPAKRLSICRARLNDAGRFEDEISWDALQQVKHECGFGDSDAIEIYPRDGDVVNVSNMRHLWILDEPSLLTWRYVR